MRRVYTSPTVATLFLVLVTLGSELSAGLQPAAPGQTPTPQPTHPVLLTDPVPDPHQQGVQWFAPTGHSLRGASLDYWNRYGGLAQFGYPLTEEFTERSGPDNKPLDVQYFERNRFEYHPENAGTPYEVLLGRLGLEFHPADLPASPLPAPARYFEQTGHNLSGPFLAYWDTDGGLFVHGFPITEQFEEVNPIDHKKYTVQYFERSRFEYHPENAGSRYEVLLGLLGRQLSQKKGYPYGWYPIPDGHAGDFSWIAGSYYSPTPGCPATECACPVFRYGGKPIELAGPAVREVRYTIRQVIFGHWASPGEATSQCYLPVYVVERAQRNPPQ